MANPYDFVPLAKVKRQKLNTAAQHSQINSEMLSGVVKCSLTVQSPLSIKSVFKKDSSQVFIPGSSLRGMLRTTMESLYGGCGFKIERDYHYQRKFDHPQGKYKFTITYDVKDCRFPDKKFAEDTCDELSSYADCSRRIDAEFKRMSESERKNKTIQNFPICPVCSLFGLTASSGISLSSRLSFEDSLKVEVPLQEIKLLRPDQPRVYRRSFYFKNPETLPAYTETIAKNKKDKFRVYQGGEYNGRKLYLHSRNGEVSPGDSPPVYAVPPQTKFTFNIHFTNLSDCEFGMLLFALKLEDGIWHKLGYGKPWGMGSVKITHTEFDFLNKSAYENFDSTGLSQNDSLVAKFKQLALYLDNFGQEITKTAQFKKLRQIWGCQGGILKYPTLEDFFGEKDFENTTIQEFNEWQKTGKRPTKKSSPAPPEQKTEETSPPDPGPKPPQDTKPEEKTEEASTPDTKPAQDIEPEPLELPISRIERNTAYVTVEGKEIRIGGYVREAEEGSIVRGLVQKKKDGRLEFIQRSKK